MKYDYNALMKEIYEEVRALDIPVSGNIEPEVQINTRAKKRYGRCMRLHGEKYEYRIEVSAYLEDKDENCVRSVLAHELLHTCPRCMNHKLLWKTYAGKMNNAYSYCITATTKEALVECEEKPVKYMLQCTKCKRQFPRMKLTAVVQHPERYIAAAAARSFVCSDDGSSKLKETRILYR